MGYVAAQRLVNSTKVRSLPHFLGRSLKRKVSIRTQTVPSPKKPVLLDVRRIHNGDDIIINPTKGQVFPYFHNISFNEPCQKSENMNKIKIAVDTGSSDFWIDSSVWCDCDRAIANEDRCSQIDAHRAKGDYLSLTYEDGFKVQGNFMHADLNFNEKSLENIGFLAAWRYENAPTGLNAMTGSVGLGYMAEQALRDKYGDIGASYWTLPIVLQRNRNVTSHAFTMWFQPTTYGMAFAATIAFGGAAKNYYEGDLARFSMLDKLGIVIPLDQISSQKKVMSYDWEKQITSHDLEGEVIFSSRVDKDFFPSGMPVMLDTGTFGMYLPHDTFKALVTSIGPYEFTENHVRKVAVFRDCDKIDLTQILQFEFGNINISIPLTAIIRNVTKREIKDKKYPSRVIRAGKKQCVTDGKNGSTRVILANC
jgi:hypothetical protein